MPTTAADAAAAAAPEPAPPQLRLVLALLDAALQAQRNGTFDELVREHPGATRWLLRRHGRVIRGTAGDAYADDALPRAAAALLRWLVTQLRPDAQPDFDAIGDEAWLHLPGWRPVLALASHSGFLPVPDFPRRYRRRVGEAVLDNLCGLWDVGPSTVYRMLDRARQAMAQARLESATDAARRLSLRRLVMHDVLARLDLSGDAGCRGWHLRQAPLAHAARDPASELWHRWQAGDVEGFVHALRQHAGVLAVEPETDALAERVAALDLAPRLQVDLWLARAALWRTRNQAERELRACEQAREAAQAAGDPLLLGIVHSALGKFYEARDADRAFACYQDSAEFLRDIGPASGDVPALEHFVTTFARLAWLYLIRNDARSKAVLDRAEALRAQARVPDAVLGMLEQVWGEYWHRAGDPARSLEHRYRALNIFERLGDERSVLAAHVNIGLDLATRGDHDRAIEFLQRVLAAARRGDVEPEVLVGAHLNLGATHFWKGDLDAAIAEYRVALEHSLACTLRLHAFRARYNLAEACYVRFRENAAAADELAGDAYVGEALAAAGSDIGPAAIESVRRLKVELLGQTQATEPNRLLPDEDAVHFDEMAEVHRQRQVLAVPGDAARHAAAHLAIARAYAAIAAKEREAALALIDRDRERAGLHARFRADFDALQHTFARQLTREQQVAAAWKSAAADLLDDRQRAALVAHLLRDGSVSKSRYAELGGVAPATASKHLGALAGRGLLVQHGKGPSTRYVLPQTTAP